MRARDIRRRAADLGASFWFTASLVALGGAALSAPVLVIDHAAGAAGLIDFLVISPTSARTILGAIASSLITIASLTSSLTIVTLQLLSNQYTPRTVRGFLRTRLSQFVFGTFIGIFLYCLILLVAVHAPGEANDPFVPSFGVILGIVLAVASLLLLVAFVNRLSQLIQVSSMAARLSRETLAVADRFFPDRPGAEGPPPPEPSPDLLRLFPSVAGYVQRIYLEDLATLARGVPLHVLVRPGDFVTRRTAVIALDRGRAAADGSDGRLVECVRVASERDLDQDPVFGVRQIVDIAVRAMSPGINDPSTAITCVRYLQEVLETLVTRDLPPRRKLSGNPDVILTAPTLDDFLTPMREIATYASDDPRVAGELADAVDAVGDVAAASCAETNAAKARSLAAAIAEDLTKSAR